MLAYKHYFNEQTNMIDLMEFEISNVYDFSNDPESNLCGEKGVHNCDYASSCASVENFNTAISNGTVKIIKCKDCGIYYPLYSDEVEWFEVRGLTSPKRCQDCREKKKKAR